MMRRGTGPRGRGWVIFDTRKTNVGTWAVLAMREGQLGLAAEFDGLRAEDEAQDYLRAHFMQHPFRTTTMQRN